MMADPQDDEHSQAVLPIKSLVRWSTAPSNGEEPLLTHDSFFSSHFSWLMDQRCNWLAARCEFNQSSAAIIVSWQ